MNYPSPSRLLPPLVLWLAAWLLLGQAANLADAYGKIAVQLPYLTLAAAAALAIQFNRSRIAGAVVVLAICYWLIQNALQTSLTEARAFFCYTSLSLLAPVALLLLAALPERGLFNLYGAALVTVPMIIFVAGLTLYRFDSTLYQHAGLLSVKPASNYILSIAASLWFAACAILLGILLCLRDNETDLALLASLLFIYSVLAFLNQANISWVMFTSAGLYLIICLLKSSHDMAYRDELTGLRGRRALNERLRGLGKRYAVAMLDVDHFKKFNDRYGHDVGDDVLKVVAKHIDRVSGSGTAYRYGGEEFSIVFAGKTANSCVPHLEAIREAIAAYEILLRDTQRRPTDGKQGKLQRRNNTRRKSVSVTISIGVAEPNETLTSPEEVIKAADKALYKAKQKGRNCLVNA